MKLFLLLAITATAHASDAPVCTVDEWITGGGNIGGGTPCAECIEANGAVECFPAVTCSVNDEKMFAGLVEMNYQAITHECSTLTNTPRHPLLLVCF